MKKKPILALALLSAFTIPALQQVHAATQTIDGFISDTMCGKMHMEPGKTDVQCIQDCIKAGSSYALIVGDKVYTLAAKPQIIAPFAGKQVHVVGDLKEKTITVTSISEISHKMLEWKQRTIASIGRIVQIPGTKSGTWDTCTAELSETLRFNQPNLPLQHQPLRSFPYVDSKLRRSLELRGDW